MAEELDPKLAGVIALTKINAHEDVCAERYGLINTSLNGLSQAIESQKSKLTGILISALLSLISLLGMAVIFFVKYPQIALLLQSPT